MKRFRKRLHVVFTFCFCIIFVIASYSDIFSKSSYYGYDKYQYKDFGAGDYVFEDVHLIGDSKNVDHLTEFIGTKELPVKRLVLSITFSQPSNETSVSVSSNITVSRAPLKKETKFFVYFNLDSYKLVRDQMDKIDSWVKDFKQKCSVELGSNSTLVGRVIGYACPLGSSKYNLKLSYNRAKQVSKVLEDLGVRVEEVRGLGETSSSQVLCLNRYVEVTLSCFK